MFFIKELHNSLICQGQLSLLCPSSGESLHPTEKGEDTQTDRQSEIEIELMMSWVTR